MSQCEIFPCILSFISCRTRNVYYGSLTRTCKIRNFPLLFISCQDALSVIGAYNLSKKWRFLLDRPWIWPWIKSISNKFDIAFCVHASRHNCCIAYCTGNRLWRHQQNVNRVSKPRGRCVKIFIFIVIYEFVILCKKYANVYTLTTNCELFMCSLESYFDVQFPRFFANLMSA